MLELILRQKLSYLYPIIHRDTIIAFRSNCSYIRCMYLATKTATSIGNNPKPVDEMQYIFMTIYWLSGVFVFAMLIGQVRSCDTHHSHSYRCIQFICIYVLNCAIYSYIILLVWNCNLSNFSFWTMTFHFVKLRDISQSATMAKTQYRSARDKMLSYMLKNNLPKELQMKVRIWFSYNWEHQKTLGELRSFVSIIL